MSWASERRAERIGTRAFLIGLPLVGALMVVAGVITAAYGETTTRTLTEDKPTATDAEPALASTPTSINLNPIEYALLDCSMSGLRAYSDPAGANVRMGPNESFDRVGGINAGTAVDLGDIVTEQHFEGSKRYWAVLKRSGSEPSTVLGYVLTGPANRPGALSVNASINNSCKPVTK